MRVKYATVQMCLSKTVKLTPEMMHHVQTTDLREKPTNSLLILLSKLNGSSPAQHHTIPSSTSAFHLSSLSAFARSTLLQETCRFCHMKIIEPLAECWELSQAELKQWPQNIFRHFVLLKCPSRQELKLEFTRMSWQEYVTLYYQAEILQQHMHCFSISILISTFLCRL